MNIINVRTIGSMQTPKNTTKNSMKRIVSGVMSHIFYSTNKLGKYSLSASLQANAMSRCSF